MNARRTTLPAPPNRVLSYRFVLPVGTIDVPSGYRRVWVFRISNRPMKSLGRWIASWTPIGTGTVDSSVAAPMYDTYIRRHPTPPYAGRLALSRTATTGNRSPTEPFVLLGGPYPRYDRSCHYRWTRAWGRNGRCLDVCGNGQCEEEAPNRSLPCCFRGAAPVQGTEPEFRTSTNRRTRHT